MSLDSPTKFDKFIESVKGFKHWNIVLILVGILVLVGGIFFVIDGVGSWWTGRGNNKRQANINALISNIATKEGTIANLQTEIAIEKSHLVEETQEHLKDVNATVEAKTETNKALANLEKAKNTNTTNSSVQDLEKILEKLPPQ